VDSAVAASLHYLTVQDVLWINLQTSGRPSRFDYAKLEEATYYQYAYGDSDEIEAQAIRFASGFGRMRPLAEGNLATGFVALAAFLSINGRELKVSDAEAASWYRAVFVGESKASDAMAGRVGLDPHAHASLQPDIRAAIRGVMAKYPQTLATFGRD